MPYADDFVVAVDRLYPDVGDTISIEQLSPSLNKVLKDFERDRLITVRYAAVDVLDPARLTRPAT